MVQLELEHSVLVQNMNDPREKMRAFERNEREQKGT